MTSDLLAALRETPGCGAMERGTDTGDVQHYFAAIGIGYGCDPCLTRLAEAVLTHYGPRIMRMARQVPSYPDRPSLLDWPSLLAALRSETPDDSDQEKSYG